MRVTFGWDLGDCRFGDGLRLGLVCFLCLYFFHEGCWGLTRVLFGVV